ncbi:hypothetical protein Acidovoranil_31910 [Acidovorax sp. FG27]
MPPNTARWAAGDGGVRGLAPWLREAEADVFAPDFGAGPCACAPKPLTAIAANSTTLRASNAFGRLRRILDMESVS